MSSSSPNPSSPSKSLWEQHKSKDGRTYWHNTQSKQSVWEKPDELKTPADKALASTNWKEYDTNGRKYWYHKESKVTTWDMPQQVKDALKRVGALPGDPSSPALSPSTTSKPQPQPSSSATPQQASTNQVPGTPSSTLKDARDRSASATGPAPGPGLTTAPSLKTTPSGGATAATPGGTTGVTPASSQQSQPQSQPQSGPASTTGAAGGAPPIVPERSASSLPNPDYMTPHEAEKAFVGLLRLVGVTSTWTWEQTMRTIITDPMYKAIKTLSERKKVWERYRAELRERERGSREKNLERCRGGWKGEFERLEREERDWNWRMDGGSGGGMVGDDKPEAVKVWWSWNGKGKKELEKRMNPEIWKMAKDDDERKVLFQEWINKLKEIESLKQSDSRQRSMNKLSLLFRNLNFDLINMRWREAQWNVVKTDEWKEDEELRGVEDLDFLIAFEEAVKGAEREANEEKQKKKEERKRRSRKAREAFAAYLQELKSQGHIQAGSKWSDFYPLIEHDDRYKAMLGNPGSSPMELFFDVVDEMDQIVEADQRIVEDFLARKDEGMRQVGEETSWEEFQEMMKGEGEEENVNGVEKEKDADKMDVDGEETKMKGVNGAGGEARRKPDGSEDKRTLKDLGEEQLSQVYKNLHDRAVRLAREERRRAEKRLRTQIDDLRYALKKADPAFELEMTYEQAVPLMESLPEFAELTNEEGRVQAWERHMKRLKEKAQEAAREKELLERQGGASDEEESVHSSKKHRSRRSKKDRETEKDDGHGDDERDTPHHKDKHKDKDMDWEKSPERDHRHGSRKDRSSRYHRDKDHDRRRKDHYEEDAVATVAAPLDEDGHKYSSSSKRHRSDRDRDRDRDSDKDRRSSRRESHRDRERHGRSDRDRDYRRSSRYDYDDDYEDTKASTRRGDKRARGTGGGGVGSDGEGGAVEEARAAKRTKMDEAAQPTTQGGDSDLEEGEI